MSKYKIISMDFDGTLLTNDKKITRKTKETLLEYKRNQFIIIGITARNLVSACSVCEINMFDYLILNNGCYIYDVKNKREKNINSFNKKNLIDIMNYFKDLAVEIDYCSLKNYYIYTKNFDAKRKFDFSLINSIDEIDEKISKINIYLENNNQICIYKKYIEKEFDNINVIIMSDTDNNYSKEWIVLNPKGINKFETLKNLCCDLNISIEEVVFFGDGINDLSIIEGVGLGVAMSNALPEIKNKAKEITLSNDEDGIAEFLKRKYL